MTSSSVENASPSLHIIVFCLNRPILCEHLLQSVNNNFEGDIALTVLYGATENQYERGFEILRKRFADPRITYVRKFQGNYRTPLYLLLRPRNLYYYLKYPYYRDTAKIFNFKSLLEKIIHESESDYLTFLTDDSFFFRKVSWNTSIPEFLSKDPKQHSFSLRHGLNIRNVPSDIHNTDQSISWNYANQGNDGHWSYRFSIDGHIYSRRFLLPFMKSILYINPNTFEGTVCRFSELKHVFEKGRSFSESVLAGVEINRVQTVSANNNLGIDNATLNQRYLEGYRLKLVVEPDARDFRPEIERLSLINPDTTEEVILL